VPNNSYKQTIDWLFTQFPSYQNIGASAYKPSLDNCLKLAELFGNPQNYLKIIHIAGTNGKGSTSSMLASILTESKLKVGLFTSPHIIDYTERIRINGKTITEEFVINFCDKIKLLDIQFEPSFFEITWIMALVYFKEQNCQICVIETGLGGRLDATNIVNPLLTIITNIGLEHTNFLGDTLAMIASEKAGIIKKNIPVIIGSYNQETLPVFKEIANKNESDIILVNKQEINETPTNFPLIGTYQIQNYKTVLKAIENLNQQGFTISQDNINSGLSNLSKNTGFFGRLQIVNRLPLTIIDVSHNYDGIKATLESIKDINKGKLHIIYGTSADKDLKSIFSLFDKNNRYYFTEFQNERSAKLEDLKSNSNQKQLKSLFFKNLNNALNTAQNTVNENDTILIFGSFFLISDYF